MHRARLSDISGRTSEFHNFYPRILEILRVNSRIDSRRALCGLTLSPSLSYAGCKRKAVCCPECGEGLDSPAPGQSIYDEAIFLSGWSDASGPRPGRRVSSRLSWTTCCCGETRLLFSVDADCSRSLGFRMLGKISAAGSEPRDATLRDGRLME